MTASTSSILVDDLEVKGKKHNVLVHFDRNGFGYTIDRDERHPARCREVRSRRQLVDRRRSRSQERDLRTSGRRRQVLDVPERPGRQHDQHRARRARHQGPAAGGLLAADQSVLRADQPRRHGLRALQGRVHRRPAVRRRDAVDVSRRKGDKNLGNFIAWDAGKGKIVWSNPEPFSVWSGALATAGGIVFYGTLEGYLKAVDQKDGKELYRFKTPSGIIGNVFTYAHKGKQYVGVYSGVGGWAGIGLAAGLTNPTDGLGAVGGYAGLSTSTPHWAARSLSSRCHSASSEV